jgi:hypothetical protein
MSHLHTREHPHPHQCPVESYSARKHPEFVVLELGDDVGALIVHTDHGMHGVEIEISPSSDDDRRSHKEVLERNAGARPSFTAVFDGLRAGTYTLWVAGEARAREVRIEGGAVTQLDWRQADFEMSLSRN